MNSRSLHNEAFKTELQKLNEAQKAAVEHLEGPVLVIAGPGTGKTQILSARIGNILLNTQTNPHNILCLTYTDAGVVAMRKRLLKFIGPDAYRVNIYTFHAFCNLVIQENLDYFGVRELQPISELETLEVFQELVDSFDSKHPLKRFSGDVYYEVHRLKELFNIMKKENYSAELIEKKAEEYLEDLPNREEYIYKRANSTKGIKAGDVNQRKVDEEKEKMVLLKAAAKEFANYEQLMKERQRYDFNDMIIWTLDAFRKNEEMLLRYQERYHYFLVDEYQDTNGAQNDILHLLTSYWEQPNVFVVGDDDQSIYRFQGANVKNIIDFYDKYKEQVRTVIMTENYRSTQSILDSSGAVIKNNKERLVNKIIGLSKDLTAQNKLLSNNNPVIREYYNTLHEEAGIVKELEQLYKDGEDLSEVAVIYRNHRLVENIVKGLELRAIPFNIKQKVNILDLPFINSIINILKYIQEEYDEPNSAEYLLYEIMHYHFFDIHPRDAAVIARECYKKHDGYRKSWHELMRSRERMFQLHVGSAKAISELEENLSYWIKEVPNLTIQGLFEKILSRGGILTYVMKSNDKIWLMQVVSTFFDFIKTETARNTGTGLREIIATLEKMKNNGIPLNLDKVVHAEKGVNFVTAHSSKGLEFKHVYLIASASRYWEAGSSRSRTYKIPDTLSESEGEDRAEEERRLFYVAMTRAKQQLTISYAAKENNDREQEMSQFVAEIIEGTGIKVEHVSLPDEHIITFKAEIMVEAEKPTVPLIDKEFLKEALKDYKMSVTHLNKYLRCPLSFYFENIIQVPTARSENMGFGNAMHFALYSLFHEMVKSPKKAFPSKEEFFEFFKKGMKNYHSHFSDKEYQRRTDYGRELLPELYDYYINKWEKVVAVEYRINNAEVDGIPVTGALDKMEFDGFKVNVVDYKTGSPDSGKKKLNAPGEKDPMGGDYWRQIVFYKILLDNDRTGRYDMISGEIDFVQKDSKKNFVKEKIYVKPEDIKLVLGQIKDSYSKIMNLEFEQGCGEEDCRWCNFVKYNYKAEQAELIKAEEED